MDLVIGLLWFLAFSVIVLFLGALNYFLGQTHSDINISKNKSQSDTTNQQQQSNSTKTSNNRRKHARNANKKRQQAAAAATIINDSFINEDKQEIKSISSEINIEEEEESTGQLLDEEQEQNEEFKDPMTIEEVLIPTPSIPIQDEQKPILPVKQRKKNKSNSINSKSSIPTSSKSSISSKEESIFLTKPQASVAPVKQLFPLMSTVNIQSTQNHQDNNSKSNGKLSSSFNIYSYTEQNSIPPRFQQQRNQQKEITDIQKFRRRRTAKNSSIPIGSAGRQNDFIPSISKQQINNNNNQLSEQNGYSSESDILPEVSLTTPPLSTESQFSLKRSDLKRSISPSNIFLNELISIFDTTSFSIDELELILNKITTKHLSNKQDRQRLSLATNDKTIERILDETYHSQAKILAIELQSEKNRVLELSKMNAEMENTIRQLQQPNNNMLPYQQTILSYQMQIRRVTDENARLVHQLHAYSVMPASINELKQQQIILNEQLRQIMIKNNNLEKEIADGERATKHAAEIYQKADMQKQERIEQMMIDINNYKKIDKDLRTLQEKHSELEKNLNLKLNNITQQRDDLQKTCDKLKEKVQEYEQIKLKYDQLNENENQTQTSNINELQQELNEAKAKNDLLRQRNWKIMEQLNKFTNKQK